jgi:hypothetical protein
MYGKCSMPEDPYCPDQGPAVPYNVSYSATSWDKNSATAIAKCKLMVHQTEEVKAINGPSSGDPNYFSYVSTQTSWPGGQPTNDTASFNIITDPAYAVGTNLSDVGGVLATGGAIATAVGEAGLEVEPWAAIAVAAGVTAQEIASGIPNNNGGSISRTDLWPNASNSGKYQSQWGTGAPTMNPSNSLAPPDWTGTAINPSGITETSSCTPWIIDRYQNKLYSVDTWGAGGYASYGEELLGTWNDEWTIGVWTWTTPPTTGPTT